MVTGEGTGEKEGGITTETISGVVTGTETGGEGVMIAMTGGGETIGITDITETAGIVN
ncbi:MAG: hypothetical protein J2P21_24200 [Chloracidobacterium sp.]|nr:hypothetical protein [Chloracidobacterium sp.]